MRAYLGYALTFAMATLLFVCPHSSVAQSEENTASPKVRLVRKPVRRVSAQLRFTAETPKMQISEWVLFAPAPPEGVGQTQASVSVALVNGRRPLVERMSDNTPLRRITLRLRQEGASSPQRCEAQISYDTMLYATKLEAGAPEKPVPPLSAAERRVFTAETSHHNFSSEPVLRFLNTYRLSRKKSETEIDFSVRVLTAMQDALKYEIPPNAEGSSIASLVCERGSSECGGLSMLFATALRANHIPARVLYGIFVNGNTHSSVEFFADGVGWIPAEIASAVSFKERKPITCIGETSGEYITLHVEPDLELYTPFGVKKWLWLNVNGMVHWSSGRGTYEGQTVKATWRFTQTPILSPPRIPSN